jgi:hypothetical protein
VQSERVTWEVGSCVGSYRLLKKLGQGAMGVVFLVEHVETGARYALKTLSYQADEGLRERFLREGQAQARVDAHPNVVGVRSAGEAGGYLYLVMDLASGGDLDERLRRGPLPPLEAAELVAALARGLAHAHAQGVLHRDLKPANVLFDDAGRPMLVDFGLARVAGETSSLTRTGDLLGTPVYMAPEQARGIREEVDQRSDVYGLGAILYQCLTGRQPFTGSSTLDVLTRVMSDDPQPPRSIVPSVSRELEAVCLRALAKSPTDRQQSAQELADELRRLLEGGAPLQGGSASVRTVGLPIAGGVLLGLLGAGAAVYAVQSRLASSEDGAATAARQAEVQAARERREARRARTGEVQDPGVTEESPPAADLDPLVAALRERGVYREGDRLRLRYSVASRGVMQTPAEPVELTRISLEMIFAAVTEVRGRELTLAATIQRLKYDGKKTAVGSARYDSQDAADSGSPFALALGRTFRVRLHLGTGEVTGVEGTDAIANGVRSDARRRQFPGLHLFTMEGFSDATFMRASMNNFFHLLPSVHDPSARTWSFDSPVDVVAHAAETAQRQLGMIGFKVTAPSDSARATRQVTVAPVDDDPGALAFAYTVAGTARASSGEVLVRDGRVFQAHAKETLELPVISAVTKEEQVFVLRNEFRLEQVKDYLPGDVVAAKWTDGKWYLATIVRADDVYTVKYEDDTEQPDLTDAGVRATVAGYAVDVGDAVLAEWEKGQRLYSARVLARHDDGVQVAWEDGSEPKRVPFGRFVLAD